jgi:RNA polymerase sigma factor (sigma-70 family)
MAANSSSGCERRKTLNRTLDSKQFSTSLPPNREGYRDGNCWLALRRRPSATTSFSDAVTNGRQRFEVPEIPDPRLNPEQRCTMYQGDQRVKRAIRRLPPRLSRMVDLYYGQECRLKEIAKALGMSEATATSTVLRARNSLRRSLNANSNACRSRSSRQ